MRNQIITRKVIGEEVGGNLAVSKEEEQKFYDEHKTEMEQPESIRLSEILVTPKVHAPIAPAPDRMPRAQPRCAASQLDEPRNKPPKPPLSTPPRPRPTIFSNRFMMAPTFEDIAKKYSDGPSAADGGALGIFKRGQLAKELEDKTFAMKAGDVTDVIRTKQGYVILKVVEHQMAGVPPMKDVLPKIQDALYYQKLQPALRTYLTKLREDAYIDIADGYVDTRRESQPDQAGRNRRRQGSRRQEARQEET